MWMVWGVTKKRQAKGVVVRKVLWKVEPQMLSTTFRPIGYKHTG